MARLDLVAPVIVVPGITASVLRDEYDLPPSDVWTTVFRRNHDRIALHPENLRYEAREPARVARSHVYPLVYEDLIEELRDDLPGGDGSAVPVYPFAYDWRMPLELTEYRLAWFIGEVIERTSLMRHYRAAGYAAAPKVSSDRSLDGWSCDRGVPAILWRGFGVESGDAGDAVWGLMRLDHRGRSGYRQQLGG